MNGAVSDCCYVLSMIIMCTERFLVWPGNVASIWAKWKKEGRCHVEDEAKYVVDGEVREVVTT